MARRWSDIESRVRAAHGPMVAGMDEVGRGPLAGPVVACAVIMPPDQRVIPGVDDSKKLLPAERRRLDVKIRARALAVGVGAASSREIDRLNIYRATVLAMRRALARLAVQPDHVIVDGKPIRILEVAHTAVVGGDSRCYSVACASIVAKVLRDSLMMRLAVRYPTYGWEHNVGYATPSHVAVLESDGPTPHHRLTYRSPQLVLDLDAASSFVSAADGDALTADMDVPRGPGDVMARPDGEELHGF